jgi:hypothetical protein
MLNGTVYGQCWLQILKLKKMRGQIVEQSDLVGEIKYFPIEVVQEMVNEQVRQGNNADASVFAKKATSVRSCFDWDKSKLGWKFWNEVIEMYNFDLFFEKFTKRSNMQLVVTIPKGCEIDKENSTFEKIVFKKIESKCPKDWAEAFIDKNRNGYFILSGSEIRDANWGTFELKDINVFKTKNQAESALAYAQLTQLMALPCYNGDWEADWNGDTQNHVIERYGNEIGKDYYSIAFSPIAFKSKEIRDAFLENHQELLKQYFQL